MNCQDGISERGLTLLAHRRHRAPHGQRGSALIVALIVLGMVATAIAFGMPSGVAAMKRINAARTRGDEKWVARGRAATGDDLLNDRLRSSFQSDLQLGRVRLQGRVLPAFDASDVPPASSVPVMHANADSSTTPTGCESVPGACTSVLGNVKSYLETRRGLVNESFFTEAAVPAGTVSLADIRVVESRTMNQGGETAYRIEYLLDATGGTNGRARQRSEVIFGVNDASCGTSVAARQTEQTITRGQVAAVQVDYTRTKSLVLSSGGVEIERRSTQDDLNTQTATFSVAPVADTTFTIDAGGIGTCTAQTVHTVRVQQPVCPVNQLFDVTPESVYGGGQIAVRWQVADAAEVRMNGAVVSASGSMVVTINSDTTFTLQARDATNACPFTVSKTARVLPCPSLTTFEAEGGRTTITRGDPPVNLRWQVDNAAPGTRVLFNGVDVAATGSQVVAPNVTTDYTLRVEPPAGSSCPPTDRTIRIVVNDRPCPNTELFEPSVSTLTEGDLVTVRWRVANADPATTTIRLTGGGLNELVAPVDSRTLALPAGSHVFTLDVSSSLPECSVPQSSSFTVTVNAKRPPDPICDIVIQSYDLSTSCALSGGVVTATWRVTSSNPQTRVQINGAGNYPLVGSANFTVNSAQTFTLSADAPTCAALTASRFVDVAQPAPTITTLSASPGTQPRQGEAVTVFYGASGAQTATINGSTIDPSGNPVNPAGGSFTFAAGGDVDFTFAVASGGCSPQAASRTIQIRPVACPVPAVQVFRANPPSVPASGQTIFEWAIANTEAGASVSITGPGVNLTGLPASGAAAANMPAAPGRYFFTITVANPCAPGNTVSQTVAVDVTCPAPQVTSFSVNPPTFEVGTRAAITFNWTTSDASGSGVTVEISSVGGGLPASGPLDVSAPAAEGTYTFTIIARNGCGAASAPVQVQFVVTPPKKTPCPVPAPGSPEATTGGGSGGAFSVSGGAGRVDTQVRIMYHSEYYPDGTIRYNLRLEVSSDPDGSQSHFLVSGGAGGREGLIGSNLGWTFYSGFCLGKSGFCGLRFLDSAGNVVLDAPFQSIQQPPGANMRVYTLVGDDGSFITTPGVSLPYLSMDFTNDRISLNSFAVNAGNIAAFSTNKGTFNTSVGGTQSTWRCP